MRTGRSEAHEVDLFFEVATTDAGTYIQAFAQERSS
jgi:hypothetical protein